MSQTIVREQSVVAALIARRRRAEWRFRAYGIAAIAFCVLAILVLFTSIISKGYSAFWQSHISIPVTFDPSVIDPAGKKENDSLMAADYEALVKQSVYAALAIPEDDMPARKHALDLISDSADTQLRDMVLAQPDIIGKTLDVGLIAMFTVIG